MLKTLVVTTSVLLLCASAAQAQNDEFTDAALFRKRISRYAPAPDRLPKGLCVCQDGSSIHGRAGELHQEKVNQVRVTCLVPGFTGNGDFVTFSTCGTFESLGR